MHASPDRRSAFWDRVAPTDIPDCSVTKFVSLGMLPAIVIVLAVGLAAWYAVLSGSAQDLMMALDAERLQAIEPAAGAAANR